MDIPYLNKEEKANLVSWLSTTRYIQERSKHLAGAFACSKAAQLDLLPDILVDYIEGRSSGATVGDAVRTSADGNFSVPASYALIFGADLSEEWRRKCLSLADEYIIIAIEAFEEIESERLKDADAELKQQELKDE